MIESLYRASWQGGLAILAVWVICRCAPQLPATVRCWLWRLTYVRLLLALLLPIALPLPVLPPATTAMTDGGALAAPVAAIPSPTAAPLPAHDGAADRIIALPVHRPSHTPTPSVANSVRQNFEALYALGVALMAFRFGLAWRRTQRMTGAGDLVTNTAVREEYAALGARLGLRRLPELRQAPRATNSPLLVGGVRCAVILLPEVLLANAFPEERRLMLAHELAHVKRRDLTWEWLGTAAQIVFFFHPLVCLARLEEKAAREIACDVLALHITGAEPAMYGRLLLHTASRHRGSRTALVGAVGAVERGRLLAQRLLALGQPSATRRYVVRALGFAIALLLLALVPWRLTTAQTPRAARPHPNRPGSEERTVVAGVVRTPNGKLAAGVRVNWLVAVDNGARRLATTTTDAAGRFRFDEKAPRITFPSTLQTQAQGWIVAQADGYAPGIGFIGADYTPLDIALATAWAPEAVFVEADGKPIPDLPVRATWLYDQYGMFPLQGLKDFSLPGMEGRTDANGVFRVSGLPQGKRVWFTFDDKRWALLRQGAEAGGDMLRARLTLTPARTISGRVTFADGRPAGHVRVWANALSENGGIGADTMTHTDGRYTIPGLKPGDFRVCVETWGKPYTTTYLPRVTLPQNESLTGVDFRLTSGAVITGHVMSVQTSKPLYGVWVGGGPASGGTRDYTSYAVTDREGVYRVRVPAGDAFVHLRNGSNVGTEIYDTPLPRRSLTVQDGEMVTVDFRVRGEAPDTTTGIVVGPDGAPVAGAEVREWTRVRPDAPWRTNAKGEFRFRALQATLDRPLRFTAQAGAMSAATTVRRGQKAPVVLHLENRPLSTFCGTVVDARGNPIAGAFVNVFSWWPGDRLGAGRSLLRTDDKGRFSATVWPAPIEYTVSAVAEGYEQQQPSRSGDWQRFRLQPGEKKDVGRIVLIDESEKRRLPR